MFDAFGNPWLIFNPLPKKVVPAEMIVGISDAL